MKKNVQNNQIIIQTQNNIHLQSLKQHKKKKKDSVKRRHFH